MNLPAMILAGGLGTRLRAVFDAGPKSMAPVGGRPFLEYLLLQISRAGFRQVLLCVGYGRTQVERWAGDGKKWGLHIHYSAESTPLGTAGAIKLAAKLIDDEAFLVLNGDSFLAVDLRELVQEHLRCEAWATVALAKVPDSTRYGTVVLNPEGRIAAFLEKNAARGNDPCCSYLVNGGIYVFNKGVLNDVPERRAVSLEEEVFPQLVSKGVKGFVSDGYFIDIGLPDDFQRAQTELPAHFSVCYPR
ncbi:MAG TPA: nucleotidyltransferase family protein [Terriglobales bacterium]|nr:nucleotidyltransferase family protein [Terriglobales bacterium]